MKQIAKLITMLALLFIVLNGCYNPEETQVASVDSGINREYSEMTGDVRGYDYDMYFCTFWSNSPGSYMGIGWGKGAYHAVWSSPGSQANIVCGKGLENGSANAIVEYEADFSVNSGDVGYLCLYGWMDNPAEAGGSDPHSVVEYYVVEAHGSWAPPGGSYVDRRNIDGSYYRIYKTERRDQPWAVGEGTGTFWQYWSVRENQRTSGTIHFEQHVDAWRAQGWNINDFGRYYQVMATEGFESTGESVVRILDWSVGSASAPLDPSAYGNVRLGSVWSGRQLTATGTADNALNKAQSANPYWSSQKWVLEAAAPTPYLRIKNVWSGKYLQVQNDQENSDVICYHKVDGWDSQLWFAEFADSGAIRLRNVWSGKYLTVVDTGNYASVIAKSRNVSWASQEWNIIE